jgi:bifunctional non-homologous end joining protein LigD
MAKKDPLKQYRDKRDFRRTREPRGGRARKRRRPRFVIQKHAARSLHYDFRIEADGVLK